MVRARVMPGATSGQRLSGADGPVPSAKSSACPRIPRTADVRLYYIAPLRAIWRVMGWQGVDFRIAVVGSGPRSEAQSGYVFTDVDGTPIRPDSATRAFTEHVAAAGVGPIVLHGLRHTHITLGLAAGIPVKVMQERACHAKVETMLAYTHVLSGMHEEAAELFDAQIIGGS